MNLKQNVHVWFFRCWSFIGMSAKTGGQALSLGTSMHFVCEFHLSALTLHRVLQSPVVPTKPSPAIGTNEHPYINVVQQTCNDTGTKSCSIPMTPLGVTYEIAFS